MILNEIPDTQTRHNSVNGWIPRVNTISSRYIYIPIYIYIYISMWIGVVTF